MEKPTNMTMKLSPFDLDETSELQMFRGQDSPLWWLRTDPLPYGEPSVFRVLHIEDDGMDLARLKATVTSRGLKNVIRIFNATTLSEAFHRLDEQLIDLIVTDLNLPDSNEEKTVRAIKSHFERMPLLVWTGSDSTGTVVESFRAGAEGYFLKNKSSSPNELIDTAQRMMI